MIVLGAALLSAGVPVLFSGGAGAKLAPAALFAGGLLTVLALAAAAAWLIDRTIEEKGRAAREEADQRLAMAEAERQQLEAVVEGMSEGVLVADSEGNVSLTNPQWRELFGSPDQKKTPSLDLHGRHALERMLATALESQKAHQIELALSRPQMAAEKTLILKSAPLVDSGGAVVVAEDVTEILHLTEVRRDFVANVSHELKTPLSAIRGFAETLRGGAKDDPEASKRFLKRILKQCTRLEALLSDLLTLSRLEHSPDKRRLAPIDLGRVAGEALEELSERVAKKKLKLEADLQPVPEIEGDAVALDRLFGNLLANAVKYNRAGGEILVRLFASGKEIVLEVEDTGIGIPEDSIERLFERFYRVDKGRSRKEGGTGLGLAIVKHAAHLHGGVVEVESELGRGSLFRVRLPRG